MKTYYIGLSVTYHDPALAIIDETGEVLFAEATERFLQNKRALNCPADPLLMIQSVMQQFCPEADKFVISINWRKQRPWYETVVASLGCLTSSGLLKTGIKRLRSPLQNYQLHHMIACQRNQIKGSSLNLVRTIKEHFPHCSIEFADFDHHLTHAATACFSSPFNEMACAVIDSFGERGSMGFYHFKHQQLHKLFEVKGTGSLGFYYMKITELCGFDWQKGEEWKIMGLAPYGKLHPPFYDVLKSITSVQGFRICHAGKNLFTNIEKLNQFKRQRHESAEKAADLAFTGQYFFAELMTQLLDHLHQQTGSRNLALAGGCALNSAFNGQIKSRTGFEQIHIPSAPADDGTALGAAWLALQQNHQQITRSNQPLSAYLGSTISDQDIQRFIHYNRALDIQHLPQSICQETAKILANGALVGWVQGRAEFGPRALGNRSILADPRQAETKDLINQQIKFREEFRPFAPSVMADYAEQYFENYQQSPYMDKTLKIKPDKQQQIAAVCHVDGTGRLQTVKQEWNPRFYQLITHFYQMTQVPVLLNTSFNVMGKPLIHSLEDAVAVFFTTGLDALVINDYLIQKPRE